MWVPHIVRCLIFLLLLCVLAFRPAATSIYIIYTRYGWMEVSIYIFKVSIYLLGLISILLLCLCKYVNMYMRTRTGRVYLFLYIQYILLSTTRIWIFQFSDYIYFKAARVLSSAILVV